ncbi:hypothetical protein [Dokdonella soli]|uniref:Uncharacterized protein n=1 Tax=Dokdonella soli TaxID=529810 RepID=A0ABN1ICE8_9GAMM
MIELSSDSTVTHVQVIGIAAALVLVAGPLLLGLSGLIRTHRTSEGATVESATRWNWKLTITSALIYTLAFNLTFFVQEFFLVLPKAFTPGLRPTLFHNNHSWEGESPLASLFQGTGALATFVTAIICVLLLRRGLGCSTAVRLFLIWMAYCGFFMALPQVVIGALSSGSDVGMAMDYFHLGAMAKTVAALVALAAIPPIALWLARALLSLAEDTTQIASARARTRFLFRAATLPALLAILLIVPFRMPRELVEVVVLPVVVTLIGTAWMQAGASRIGGVKAEEGGSGAGSIAWLLCAVLLLLLVFQLLLRPGIRFY